MAPVHAHVSLSAAISLVWLARLLLHAGGEWPAPRTRALASGVAAMLVLGCAAFAAVSWARIGAILTYYR